MKYLVVIEKAGSNYAAYLPDLLERTPHQGTATVMHRGGPCLHVSRNRQKIGLDSIDNSCYQKTLKKPFPISSIMDRSNRLTVVPRRIKR